MENKWAGCKNILCIRPDNMGDLIMNIPAIRALKETFSAQITVLTSSMAAGIAGQIAEIDHVMTFDLPWVKLDDNAEGASITSIIEELKARAFNAAVIFTVYSQNPLPSVMLAYMADIPLRLAYCRENPYQLLTNWLPDKEPYTQIKHQVQRDLDLVAHVGATTQNEKLALKLHQELWPAIENKLSAAGLDMTKSWLILHAGVSELKRQYPFDLWVEAAREIKRHTGYQILLTGTTSEKYLTDHLQQHIGKGSISIGGLLTLSELVTLIDKSPLLISVNTGTIHIAAAVQTPVLVLYALTNPQHTPWRVPCKVLTFAVDPNLLSRNEVIKYVSHLHNDEKENYPSATKILDAAKCLLYNLEFASGEELKLVSWTNHKLNLS